ncbi:MAG: hypothetical protein HY813_03415 [Candidatus Portnoybacteria bacterium]|nr:hypothetical protein [Candidatus Portnoybacteria bacterium]
MKVKGSVVFLTLIFFLCLGTLAHAGLLCSSKLCAAGCNIEVISEDVIRVTCNNDEWRLGPDYGASLAAGLVAVAKEYDVVQVIPVVIPYRGGYSITGELLVRVKKR